MHSPEQREMRNQPGRRDPHSRCQREGEKGESVGDNVGKIWPLECVILGPRHGPCSTTVASPHTAGCGPDFIWEAASAWHLGSAASLVGDGREGYLLGKRGRSAWGRMGS